MGRTPPQTSSPTTRSGYLATLDGWRTIAIAGVLLDHATAGILRRSSLYPFFRTGPNGVSVFFAVSGFLICSRLLEEEQLTGTFLLKLSDTTQQNFPAVADTLAVGCLLAIFAPHMPKIKLAWGVLMLFPIVLVPLYLGATRLHTLVLLFLFWPIMNASIAGFLLHVVQSPWRILNIRPIVWLGKISYSLYLWQELFAYGPHGRFWYDPLFAVGLACVSYYLIEQPMLRLRERRTKEQRPELPAPMANSAEGRQVDLGTAAGF